MTCVLLLTAILIIVGGMAIYELHKEGVWRELDQRMSRK